MSGISTSAAGTQFSNPWSREEQALTPGYGGPYQPLLAHQTTSPNIAQETPPGLAAVVARLTQERVQALLVKAANRHPELHRQVMSEYHAVVEKERARDWDFDEYSISTWRLLNKTYNNMRDSAIYTIAGEVLTEVCETIEDSIAGLVHPYSSFATKQSAIVTLRKIGKTICLAEDYLGYEIRRRCQHDETLVKSMAAVLDAMTPQERVLLGPELVGNVEELVRLGAEYGIFDGMKKKVLDRLRTTAI
jgi:hypothetical protein